jgi:hypothetical protein
MRHKSLGTLDRNLTCHNMAIKFLEKNIRHSLSSVQLSSFIGQILIEQNQIVAILSLSCFVINYSPV